MLFLLLVILYAISCSDKENNKTMTQSEMAVRGKYLVNAAGCNDCHSPKMMTSMGPVPDTTKLLSGHPANDKLPDFDWKLITDKHLVIFTADLTATAGPWGISYTANLTPDAETGIGGWTKDIFFSAIRNGKHLGIGRPILPPMPWENFKQLTDQDLESIFTYLKTLPPIKNKVPDSETPKM
jgi:mono/diheme cytochrome c family protein